MLVRAPGSTANVGSGFDAVAIAASISFELSSEPSSEFHPAEAGHPAHVAFERAGGLGRLWWRSRIPSGRGLGFSGAARIAGAFAARTLLGDDRSTARREAFLVAAELEGHADNAAASAFGGVVATSGGRVAEVPIGVEAVLVVWSPSSATSTSASRSALPETIAFSDAVFNVGRAALLVAAVVSGDWASLRVATEDRLHQGVRLASVPQTDLVLSRLRDSRRGVAWLSGSGPSVAALVPRNEADELAELVTDVEGTVRVLDIDTAGVVVVPANPE